VAAAAQILESSEYQVRGVPDSKSCRYVSIQLAVYSCSNMYTAMGNFRLRSRQKKWHHPRGAQLARSLQ
jgi:hypothetical protein